MSKRSAPDGAAFQSLGRNLEGSVVEPGDPQYDDRRTGWNALHDRRPAAIALCENVRDVVAAVRFARNHELLLSVRSTGHDYAGNSACDDGLVIDLSGMQRIAIDAARRRARVEPGVTWGLFDAAAQAYGLATTGGTVSTVGVAGYTLGGGTGHLLRRFGLGADNLLSAEVVTSAGNVVHASDEENTDLFWAVRGGGGNFGIVTAFEFQLHAVGPVVTAGQIVHRLADSTEVLRRYRDFMATTAPDALQCYAFFINCPPLPVFPEDLHGTPILDLVVTHSGDPAAAENDLAPLRSWGTPVFDGVQAQAYLDVQQAFDAAMPKGLRWYSTAHYLDALTDPAIDTLVAHVQQLPAPYTSVYLEPMGGAVARIPPHATAFPHRQAAFGLHIFPGWDDQGTDDEAMRWARRVHDAMAPHAAGGAYVNLLAADASREGVESAYGVNYERLAEIKRRWDPENVFRMNHNIRPAW